MHIIVSLDLLGTLIAVLEQKTNEDISSPIMLKSFFLSERQLVNAIVRVMLETCLFLKKLNVICNAGDQIFICKSCFAEEVLFEI